MTDVKLVAFGPEHIEEAAALSRETRWPHRREDWVLLLGISQGVVALAAGRVVGTALCTPFDANLAAINMIIVGEGQRGRGLGRRLMQAVMNIAGDRTMRLVATEDGRRLYQKLGFVADGQIVQHQGIANATPEPEGVMWASRANHAEIAALDRQAFGADRGALFAHILPLARTAMIRGQGRLLGFAVCRPFGHGYVIGPMAALRLDDAKQLAAAQIASHPNTFLRVDVHAESGFGAWLAEQELRPVSGGTVMYRGRPPLTKSDSPHVFALASQALG